MATMDASAAAQVSNATPVVAIINAGGGALDSSDERSEFARHVPQIMAPAAARRRIQASATSEE